MASLHEVISRLRDERWRRVGPGFTGAGDPASDREGEGMGALRALVADDEQLSRRRLKRLLTEQGVNVVAEATDGRGAARILAEEAADVAFLDIEMPGLDGLQVVREAAAERVPRVVFVTAHDKYAIQAFELHAVDFLLKPFDRIRLAKTLEHVRQLHRTGAGAEAGEAEWAEKVGGLVEALLKKGPATERGGSHAEHLLVKEEGSLRFLRVRDIEWIEADGNYVRLNARGEEHLVRRQIGELESQLDARRFLRIHRSAIVNIDAVSRLVPWFSGGYLVHLDSGKELKLSRSYATRLFENVGTAL